MLFRAFQNVLNALVEVPGRETTKLPKELEGQEIRIFQSNNY